MTPKVTRKQTEVSRVVLRGRFELESGEKHWTNPVCHGEIAYASWKYQQWLEDNLIQMTKLNDAAQQAANIWHNEVESLKKEGGV